MQHQIAVIGSGYAGVMAANALARRGHRIRLFTERSTFVHRIRLHEYAASTLESAELPLADLLHPTIEVVHSAVVDVDAAARAVTTAAGDRTRVDGIVLATGSGARPSDLPDGVHRVADLAGATALRRALEAEPDRPMTVVGAGLTGIELTAAAAHSGRRVTLVDRLRRDAGPDSTRDSRAHARRLLELGVRLRHRSDLAGIEHAAQLGDPAAIVVDAVGFAQPGLGASAGLEVDERGRVLVAPDLGVPNLPGLVVAGDAAAVTGPLAAHLRPACATAIPMGRHAAATLDAQLHGRATRPFSLGYLARCVDLAGGRGWVQPVTADDQPWSFGYGGLVAGLTKRSINAATVRWMTDESTRPWLYAARRGPRTSGRGLVADARTPARDAARHDDRCS